MNPDNLKHLRVYSEMFNDAQRFRIMTENRLRSATTDSGLGAETFLKATQELETIAQKALIAEYRAVAAPSIRAWQEESVGIGEHTLARLLGVIGHPRIATPHHWEGSREATNPNTQSTDDEAMDATKPKPRMPVRTLVPDPLYQRNVAKLWAYCGHGDPSRRRRKDMTQEEALALGSPRAKMLVHLMAELCIRQRHSPYRVVYDEARAKYAEKVDETGKAWTDLHKHNAALRKVGKRILQDLWVASPEAVGVPEKSV